MYILLLWNATGIAQSCSGDAYFSITNQRCFSYTAVFSASVNALSSSQAINTIAARLQSQRVTENEPPNYLVSNKNIGIFSVAHAPTKTMTLKKLAPFFIITAATGKAP